MALIHLLDIPDLHHAAFRPVAGRLRLYGKSDAPPPPNYAAQANATAEGNLAAARATTGANRIDQMTPYGSIKYTQGDGFDSAGYDAAVTKYREQQAALDANPNGGMMRQYLDAIGQTPKPPDRNSFVSNPDHWASQIDLSDTGRQLLDADSRARLGYAGLQDQAMGRVRDTMSTGLNTEGIPDWKYTVDLSGLRDNQGMQAWDKASGLIMDRLNPELDSQQRALDTKLANQGLTAGSEGWDIGQRQFGKQRNDAGIGAQLAGAQLQDQFYRQASDTVGRRLANAGLKNQTRGAALQERAYLRNLPMNELSALRTGAQVTNPTFSTPGQQGQTSGPDLMGASSTQYNQAVGQVNAQNQQSAQNTAAGVGAVATIAAAFF